jgi:hypothetical protein
MAQDYNIVWDEVIRIFDSYRETALSKDMTVDVTSVNAGMYVPGVTVDKPILYVRPFAPYINVEMAGGIERLDDLTFLISGAASGSTQALAIKEVTKLMNNAQSILMHNGRNTYWSGTHFGLPSMSEDIWHQMGDFTVDPGEGIAVAHFRLYWGCVLRISREALT